MIPMKRGFSRRNRKGQSAIEYLTTYGWALLAIVIVGAVLMQMGVFSQCQTTQPRFSGQSVAISSWAYSNSTQIDMELQAINQGLTINNVSVTYDSGTMFNDDGVTISAGQTTTVTIGGGNGVLSSGSCASGDVEIDYTVSGSGVDGIASGSGSLTGPVP